MFVRMVKPTKRNVERLTQNKNSLSSKPLLVKTTPAQPTEYGEVNMVPT